MLTVGTLLSWESFSLMHDSFHISSQLYQLCYACLAQDSESANGGT